MLLTIDVGNTNIVYGVYDGEKLFKDFRISTIKTRTSDEYGILFYNTLLHSKINPNEIDDIILSSVVPNLMHTIASMIIKYFHKDPILAEYDKIYTGLNIKYDNPKQVGADRIVNSVAVLKKYGGPAIIIDIGTAITFCVLNENKDYLGGLIFPGMGISADALFLRTSKLPRIEMVKPEKIIGTNTVSGIQSGLFYGFISMIDGLIDKIMDSENLDEKNVNIIVTGGLSKLLYSDLKHDVIMDKDLTLYGLKVLYDMNKDKYVR